MERRVCYLEILKEMADALLPYSFYFKNIKRNDLIFIEMIEGRESFSFFLSFFLSSSKIVQREPFIS